MSQWTHVNGSIRVDALRMTGEAVDDEKLVGILGKIVTFESSDYETKLPCGSEGSLRYTLWTNPYLNALSAYTITIFGDLRDYGDADAITEWFTNACSDFGMIRSAILEIRVEGGETRVLRYERELGSLSGVAGIEIAYTQEHKRAE